MKTLLSLVAAVAGGALVTLGQSSSTDYKALYVFGDSLDATSGGPYWQGRWSNGPMWPELLSTNLGFPYQSRNNRAVGGAISADFLSQIRSLSAPTNAASALFVIDVGHNDFVKLVLVTNETTLSSAILSAVVNRSNSVVECYQKGARTMAVININDPNRIPYGARIITNASYVRSKTIALNATLKTTEDSLAANYPDLRLLRIDLFGWFDVVVTNFAHYGFARWDLGALEDPELNDKGYSGPGKDYFTWEGSHLTARAHAMIADAFLAAVRGASLRGKSERDRFRLTFASLQIGKMYQVQETSDLMHWADLVSFPAFELSQNQDVPWTPPRSFFRLLTSY